MIKKLILPLFLAAFSAGAAVLPFRSGDILDAELSQNAPAIANLDKFDYDFSFGKQCYALVTVRPTRGRALSTHDYSLVIFGRKYPCVAIREDNGGFDADKWKIDNPAADRKYGMLFILDGSVAGNDEREKIEFQSNAPGKYPALKVPFTNRRGSSFSSSYSIPAAGKLKLDE